jgi:putative endonuclease
LSKNNLILGKDAESRASGFLKRNGYKILRINYKNRLGEIDIIAQEDDVLCFVEVKCRRSDRFGSGLEAVTRLKQKKLSEVALVFLKENKLLDRSSRFDVVSIDYSLGVEKIGLIRNAFDSSERFGY